LARRILISLLIIVAIGALYNLSLRRRESALDNHPWARATFGDTVSRLGKDCSMAEDLPDGRVKYTWYGTSMKDGVTRTLTLPYKRPEDITESR
jgi:hypothetical protein